MKNLTKLTVLALVLSLSFSAYGAEKDPYLDYELDRVEVTELMESMEVSPFTESLNPCRDEVRDMGFLDKVSIGQIVNVAAKVWKLVEKNKPVVNTKGAYASALPKGVTCWQDLAGWQAPRAYEYKWVYKNLYGITVVDFRYKVVFTPNGSFMGKGKYLSHVTILPTHLDVAWGYKFNSHVKIMDPVNMNTETNPIAGMEAHINWSIDTVLKHSEKTIPVFVDGRGNFTEL